MASQLIFVQHMCWLTDVIENQCESGENNHIGFPMQRALFLVIRHVFYVEKVKMKTWILSIRDIYQTSDECASSDLPLLSRGSVNDNLEDILTALLVHPTTVDCGTILILGSAVLSNQPTPTRLMLAPLLDELAKRVISHTFSWFDWTLDHENWTGHILPLLPPNTSPECQCS